MPIASTVEEIQAIYHEIEGQSDRGMAIIAASITEEFLTDALKQRLILTNTISERLFSYEKNGPLSNFSSKIMIGYAVGLLSAKVRQDLDLFVASEIDSLIELNHSRLVTKRSHRGAPL